MPHTSDRKPGDVPTQEERETNPVGSSEEEASSNIPPRPSDHSAPTRCDARASRLARQAATNVNETVLVQLGDRLPKIAALLEEAEDDVLAYYAFPAEHRRQLRSTNPLERFNREIGRRTDVVGIFPDDASLIRLVSMLAIEANDESLVGRGYMSRQSMEPLLEHRAQRVHREEAPELQAALSASCRALLARRKSRGPADHRAIL